MSDKPLSEIANPQTRIDEFDLRVRRGSPAELARTLLEGIGDVYPPLRKRAGRTAADVDDRALTDVLSGLAVGDRRVNPVARAHALEDDDVPPPNAPVRQAACLALRGAKDDASLEALVAASDDEDADVRYQALVSLHFRAPAEDVLRPIIDERLVDDDSEVRIVAAQIVGDRGWTDYVDDIESMWADATGELHLQLAFVLSDLASHDNVQLRDATRDELVDELIDALSDEETVAAATQALARLDAEQARDELRGVVNGWFGHPLHKVEAAAALVQLGDDQGADYLAKSLDSHRKDARGYAIRLVGKLGLDEYFARLEEKARSDDYHADTAVLALGDFGGESARDALEDIADDHPNDEVRALAQNTLATLNRTQDSR
jgi:HEAT repeat protein